MDNLKIKRYTKYLKNGDIRYCADLRHVGLNKQKSITDEHEYILDQKVENTIKIWDSTWQKFEEKRIYHENIASLQGKADNLDRKAKETLASYENILKHTLNVDDTVDWDELKIKLDFLEDSPNLPNKENYPSKPDKRDQKYKAELNFLDKIFSSRKVKKEKAVEEAFELDIKKWEVVCKIIDDNHNNLFEKYNADKKKWEERKKKYDEKKYDLNQKIERLKNDYTNKKQQAIIEHAELVLNKSEYPPEFPQNFELQYNESNEGIIVEYDLPSPSVICKIKEVRFISSKKEIKEAELSERDFNNLYDKIIYQICLRTIHELIEADKIDAIKMITFNGWVNEISKSTGQEQNNCIISLQVTKEEFSKINLAYIDPKECFKSLKGIGSKSLIGIIPIRPILTIDKTDSRIIDYYNVAHTLDEGYNLASMNWEDFEHLVRELFEQEFKAGGGEVKITQSSSDGGVDAIAFDPDPIRGGKIVIQAKRYTNTVGVSAIRDLYGTVQHEGATKGIIITTSDYGRDAHTFAKGKPLTLLNGAELLGLLNKHGHKARIDIAEAKNELKNKL